MFCLNTPTLNEKFPKLHFVFFTSSYVVSWIHHLQHVFNTFSTRFEGLIWRSSRSWAKAARELWGDSFSDGQAWRRHRRHRRRHGHLHGHLHGHHGHHLHRLTIPQHTLHRRHPHTLRDHILLRHGNLRPSFLQLLHHHLLSLGHLLRTAREAHRAEAWRSRGSFTTFWYRSSSMKPKITIGYHDILYRKRNESHFNSSNWHLAPCPFVSWLTTMTAPLNAFSCRNVSPPLPITEPTWKWTAYTLTIQQFVTVFNSSKRNWEIKVETHVA